jgi:hypothetical protein
MKKLQAAIKDSNWRKNYKLNKVAYKVGSFFKACHHCGDYELDDAGRKRYSSGYEVYRSYAPKDVGFTYWCYLCGAKDQAAWENASDIGQDARRGSRQAILDHKREDRKRLATIKETPKRETIESQIDRLEIQLRQLMAAAR